MLATSNKTQYFLDLEEQYVLIIIIRFLLY
jgi:hypothetical protein